MRRSHVVTGGARGIGRATAERLLGDTDTVVVIDTDPAALAWTHRHPAGPRLTGVVGDAASETVAEHAADLAEASAPLAGWVNNAAVFSDAWLHEVPASRVRTLVAANLDPVVVGCATAVRRFLRDGSVGGAIVNVSSHQAPRSRGTMSRRPPPEVVTGPRPDDRPARVTGRLR